MNLASSVIIDGALWVAIPLAMLAGLVSFLSPCVLPLVPGYLSYITGLTGAELGISAPRAPASPGTAAGTTVQPQGTTAQPQGTTVQPQGTTVSMGPTSGSQVAVASPAVVSATQRSQVLAGTVGFVLGFSAVFVAYGALFGALGGVLVSYQDQIQRVLGVMVIILGLTFAGWLPGLSREFRVHRLPRWGVWGAPVLGVLFGLGWTPCIGPTLAAVQTLAFSEASAWRGAVLSLAYCLGLGLPFIALGLAFRRFAGALTWVRLHSLLIMRIGGIMLIAIGLALVTGLWDDLTVSMRVWAGSFEVPL